MALSGRFVIALALALVIVGAAPRPGRADGRKARAAALFAEAQAAEARREWRAAIDAYRAAYELAPHPSVLYNIGLDQERLEEYRAAATSFLRYLDLLPRAADRDRVLARVRSLQQRPSRVTIATRPDGARVLVNGDERGRAPLTLTMEGGVRSWIVAELDGRRSPRRSVWVEYGEPVVLTLELGEPMGTLRVTSDVAGAEVAVDGRPVGRTPLEVAVAAGAHVVVVSRVGHRPATHRVEVPADGGEAVRAELIAGAGPAPAGGQIHGGAIERPGPPAAGGAGGAFLVGTEYGLADGSLEYALALGARPASAFDVAGMVGVFDGEVGLGGEVRVYLARGALRPYLRGGAVHRFGEEARTTEVEGGGGVVVGGGAPGRLGLEYFLQVSARRRVLVEELEAGSADQDDEPPVSVPVVIGVRLRLGS